MRFKILRSIIEVILRKWVFYFQFWISLGRFTVEFLFGIGKKADERGIALELNESYKRDNIDCVSPIWMHWLILGEEWNPKNDTVIKRKWNWG